MISLTVEVQGDEIYGTVGRVAPSGAFIIMRGGNTGGNMLVPVDFISSYRWGKVER